MNKKRITKPAIILIALLILGLICYISSLNTKMNYQQKRLEEACLTMLQKVQFAYKYDNMTESDIRAVQAVDLNNLKNAQSLIYYTSWKEKDKINEMVVALHSYYSKIYSAGGDIEVSKAMEINKNYIGVLINIDNEYCLSEIDIILNFLEEETKKLQ